MVVDVNAAEAEAKDGDDGGDESQRVAEGEQQVFLAGEDEQGEAEGEEDFGGIFDSFQPGCDRKGQEEDCQVMEARGGEAVFKQDDDDGSGYQRPGCQAGGDMRRCWPGLQAGCRVPGQEGGQRSQDKAMRRSMARGRCCRQVVTIGDAGMVGCSSSCLKGRL